MPKHPCIRWGLYGFLLAWAALAYGQDPPPTDVVLVPPLDSGAALFHSAIQLGLPGAIGYGFFQLRQAITSWTPTIKIVIENPQVKVDPLQVKVTMPAARSKGDDSQDK